MFFPLNQYWTRLVFRRLSLVYSFALILFWKRLVFLSSLSFSPLSFLSFLFPSFLPSLPPSTITLFLPSRLSFLHTSLLFNSLTSSILLSFFPHFFPSFLPSYISFLPTSPFFLHLLPFFPPFLFSLIHCLFVSLICFLTPCFYHYTLFFLLGKSVFFVIQVFFAQDR